MESKARQGSRVLMRPVLGCVTCAIQASRQLAHASFVSRFQVLFGTFDEDRSSNRRVEICTFDVDDGKAMRPGPCLTSCTHGTEELQRLQWWGRRKEIVYLVVLHLATNELASIVWPGRITLVRVYLLCGDDLATHLLSNVPRYFLVHAHLLGEFHLKLSGLHCQLPIQRFPSRPGTPCLYIILQRSISASSS